MTDVEMTLVEKKGQNITKLDSREQNQRIRVQSVQSGRTD